ncbi:MAG: hypothetical protein WCG27_01285, partial [Pseudomonadota bacterium]
STDAVLIKKISLHLWTLRDEIEAAIIERSNTGQVATDVPELIADYGTTPSPTISPQAAPSTPLATGPQLVPTPPVETAPAAATPPVDPAAPAPATPSVDPAAPAMDPDEMEMAKAIAEAKAAEDAQKAAASMLSVAAVGPTDNQQKIVQKVPELSEENIHHGSTILQEIGMERMSLFTDHHFLEGQSIVIEFLIPKRFIVSASVVVCKRYNMKSRIIGEMRLPFRMSVQFTFTRPGERTLMREFLKSISSLNYKEKKSKTKSSNA